MPPDANSAEARYRAAFERLKINKPAVLPVDTPVSQNNVAKEAGRDPSALKGARFPALIAEIQAWIEIQDAGKSAERQVRRETQRGREDLETRLRRAENERDSAQSQLVSAHRQLLELLQEKTDLERKLAELTPPISQLPRGRG